MSSVCQHVSNVHRMSNTIVSEEMLALMRTDICAENSRKQGKTYKMVANSKGENTVPTDIVYSFLVIGFFFAD